MARRTLPGSFRDRLLTPAGARAITHPLALVAAGAAAGTLLALSAPVAVAAGLGAAAWAGVVATRVPKGTQRPAAIGDPFLVADPWRQFVVDAVNAQRRFDAAVASSDAFTDTLTTMRSRMQAAVDQVAQVAESGNRLSNALAHLPGVDRLAAEGEAATRQGATERAESLAGQLRTVAHLAQLERDTVERLQTLDAQLDEAVARAVALPLEADQASGMALLADDLDQVLGGLRSLSAAVAELDPDVESTPGTA